MSLLDFKRIAPTPIPPSSEPTSPKVSADTLIAITKFITQGTGVSPFSAGNETLLYADSDDGINGHYKQWSIEQKGKTVITRWGKVGATLQSKTKVYGASGWQRRWSRKPLK